jgi:peptidoglycan/xylan/chitin deacetylase (PgdA/CDA1 family)
MLSKIRAARTALLYWLGVAGGAPLRGARILTVHGTPRCQSAHLERQLRYLKRQFHVVPLGRLVERLEDTGANVDGMVALTFDDGLLSNVEVAYPLLRKLQLPATFFICPGLIEHGRWQWTHEVQRRLGWLEAQERSALARKLRAPADIEAFVAWMKRLDIAARRAAEDALCRDTPDFMRTWADHEEYDVANWDELHQLDPELITIGSHSLSHPVLPSLGPAEMEAEIAESRRLIETRLQRPAEFFAYPDNHHNVAVRELVRRHYRAAVASAKKCIERPVDLHLLPRLSLPGSALRLALAMHLAGPQPAVSRLSATQPA